MPPTSAKPYWQSWYEIVEDESLRQGDIFRDLIVFSFPQDLPLPEQEPAQGEQLSVEAQWHMGDWIVMSASCDVVRGSERYPWVLLAQVIEANPENLNVTPGKKFDERVEVLKREYDPTRFLLSEYPKIDPAFPQSFVSYRPHLTVPLNYLKRGCTGPRLRLRSPFREQFGNWVGANISRVGIEEEDQIPREGKITLSASKLLASGEENN